MTSVKSNAAPHHLFGSVGSSKERAGPSHASVSKTFNAHGLHGSTYEGAQGKPQNPSASQSHGLQNNTYGNKKK